MSATAPLVDVNAWLGSWPFQYFHESSASRLERRLATEGIGRAMVGNPEVAFNQDCMESNRLLLRRLGRSSAMSPVPALDPTKGDWRDVLSLCRDRGARAVRLFPGYHCYELESAPALEAVERIALEAELALFVQIRMEDERTHHPLCRIPAVPVASVIEAARRFPALAVVALCPVYHEAVELAKGPPNICFDISYVERMRTIASLLEEVPLDRVLFGTHAPFLQPRAAVMKIGAPYVTEAARRAIGAGNADRILGGVRKRSARRRRG